MFKNVKKTIKNLISPDLKFKLDIAVGKLEKLGSSYGGWIIPVDYLNKKSICYMVGAGEDISFDFAVAKRFRCEVLIFDPTPRSKAHYELVVEASHLMNVPINNNPKEFYDLDRESFNYIRFYEIGLWKKTDHLK